MPTEVMVLSERPAADVGTVAAPLPSNPPRANWKDAAYLGGAVHEYLDVAVMYVLLGARGC